MKLVKSLGLLFVLMTQMAWAEHIDRGDAQFINELAGQIEINASRIGREFFHERRSLERLERQARQLGQASDTRYFRRPDIREIRRELRGLQEQYNRTREAMHSLTSSDARDSRTLDLWDEIVIANNELTGFMRDRYRDPVPPPVVSPEPVEPIDYPETYPRHPRMNYKWVNINVRIAGNDDVEYAQIPVALQGKPIFGIKLKNVGDGVNRDAHRVKYRSVQAEVYNEFTGTQMVRLSGPDDNVHVGQEAQYSMPNNVGYMVKRLRIQLKHRTRNTQVEVLVPESFNERRPRRDRGRDGRRGR